MFYHTNWYNTLTTIIQTVGLKSTLHVTDNGVQEPKDKGLKVIYDSGETDILFGTYQSLNSHQVLAAMPSREIADQLITQYFSQGTLASGEHIRIMIRI